MENENVTTIRGRRLLLGDYTCEKEMSNTTEPEEEVKEFVLKKYQTMGGALSMINEIELVAVSPNKVKRWDRSDESNDDLELLVGEQTETVRVKETTRTVNEEITEDPAFEVPKTILYSKLNSLEKEYALGIICPRKKT